MDFKKRYIIRCVQSLLGINQEPEELIQSQKLEQFLTSTTVYALIILYKPGKKLKIMYPQEEFPFNPNILLVSIIKMSDEITMSNLPDGYNISLSTADCLKNFGLQLTQVYLPLIKGQNQQNIISLISTVSSQLGNSNELSLQLNQSQVQNISDQFLFWRRVIDNATGPQMKKKGEYFIECYKEIQQLWMKIDTLQSKDLKELIDITFAALDDVWNDTYPYNSKRFASLIKCMTHTLWRVLSTTISKISLQEKKNINFVEQMIKTWFKFLEQYRSGNWRVKTFPYTQRKQTYFEKIEDVKQILNLMDEVKKIKSKINLQIDITEISQIFNDTVPLSLNPILNKNWSKAKKIFLSVVQSKLPFIITYFKESIISISKTKLKPIKALQQLKKWNQFLSINLIKSSLKQEMTQIFKIVSNYIDQIKHQFQSRTGQSFDPIPGKQSMMKIKNFSPFLCGILWGRQTQDKLRRILNYSCDLFKQFQDLEAMKYEVQEIIKDIQNYETDQLNKWKSQITQASYSDQGLQLQKDAKMMNLDLKNSILTVNYSDRLIILIREIRQLSQLGLKSKIPAQIIQSAEYGKKYYKQALSLKKIANFYNNMNSQIIESQKGMLLKELQHFQQSVKSVNSQVSQKDQITWDKPSNVQKYISSLNNATVKLVKENSRLYKIHQKIMDIIIELSNQDLRKNKNVWLGKLQQIKELVQNACADKEAKYCRKWKVHCDIQLYKIIQMQFLNGLQDSESVMSDINVQIIIKNKNISFRPSIEQLKDKYYKEIMAYIMWPSRVFRGIIGNLDLYQKIGQKNSLAIKNLISKAQSTFSVLLIQLKNFEQWSAIPYLTVKNISQKIKTMQQWQFNIKVIRMKRKDLQKIPDHQKIQCFNINNIKFKNQADQYLSDFLEQMMNSLKQSVIKDSKQIQNYLQQSLLKLSTKPKSMEEMQQMKSTYLQIKGKQKQNKRKLEQTIIKKKWILQATGYNHQTEHLQQSWAQFSNKIQDYDTLLAQQIEHLKSLIQNRISQIQGEISKYQSKTSSIIIPNNRNQLNQLIQFLKQQKNQEEKIIKKISTLRSDCEQFQLSIPTISIKTIQWNQWSIFQQYCQQIKQFQTLFFIKMKAEKMYEFQDFCLKWHQKLKNIQKTRQSVYIIKQIDLFKSLFSIIKSLSSGILERDHWKHFFLLIKATNLSSDNLKLQNILNAARSIVQKLPQIQDLLSRAQGQATLRQALQQLAIWWQTAQFQLTVYEGKRDKCHLIKQWKQMTSKVSDNMSLVTSLKQSRWIGRFSQQIESYQKKIGKVQRALYSMNNIQRKWIYLQPILVRGALPEQLQRFNKLDASFRNVMRVIAQKPKLYTLADIEGLDNILDSILDEQQKCQKALNDYLEVKRTKFPRFYFLGDEDLLQILAQTQNPQVIQLHMKKLFAAIHSVQFSNQNKEIVSILSIEKEKVHLIQKVILVQNVETWLDQLQKKMFKSLQQSLNSYIKSNTKQIKLAQYCSQILCLMEEIRFSSELQQAITTKNIKPLESKLKQDLQNLTKILPTVSKLQAIKLKAIILDLIHHLNIVSNLIKDQKPVTLNSYTYKKNFKFTRTPQLCLFDYKYKYTFQYQGNLPKLVHTPLTDKCYITLSLALSLGMGGNPYGPAGTGKTETVKAMAMLFGRMCLVFNCDEGLDFRSMGRIFLGLVRCGAWGCFDQFNRLLEEQLSAISQQIQIIQFAIKSNKTHLELIGKTVQVNANSGIFVTLNPAGKGYGGRSRLPDNLKQLFRPVAMSVPDNQLIAQVLLYSEGFKQAKVLAQKVICLFTLSKQLLSQQQHYDWGLRALKTILSVAGRLIFNQRSKQGKQNGNQLSFQTENQLLIKAIRINTLSKLTFTDMRKFKFLLQDIFPGIQSKDILYQTIEEAVKWSISQLKLTINQSQVQKILQFYQATQQRMGVVLVGPSGCGKTTIWKVLKKAYQKLTIPLKTYLINPKSMPRQQLLGQMNNDTRQFNEGVLTVSARQVVKNGGHNWIVLDGDVDPQWIESLNSVLDDNHLLTLPTGQRINFSNSTCFIFQTDSLFYASPATVSRMGMIYLNNEDINIQGVIQKWSENQPQLEKYFSTLNLQTLIGFDQQVQSTLIGQVNQVLSQMKGVQTQSEFIAAAVKGLTANCLNDKHQIVNKIFERFNEKNPFTNKQSMTIYAEKNQFRSFSTLPQQFSLDDILSQNSAIFKTAITQSYLSILKKWVDNSQNFIMVGPQGCGKSLLIKQSFSQIKKTLKINFATMYCNSQTNALHVIQKLYQICSKGNSGAGKILRPKQCARQVLYLKDINLPKPDKYQTIQLASFLQQVISHKGFYDPTTLQFVQMDEKIQIVISMFPPSSIGRNQLTQRLTAIVKIINVQYPTNQELLLIYIEYFRGFLRQKKMDQQICKPLAQFYIDCYTHLKSNFTVDEHRHYNFTPKSLFSIFKSLILYQCNDRQSLIESIINQLCSQFKNKIVSLQRKNKFDQIILGLAKNHFKITIKNDYVFSFISGKYQKMKKEDYLNILKSTLIQFERFYHPITFVPHQESISQISSIQKVLASTQGNLVLLGESGIGKQTNLILASIILKIDVIKLVTLRDFGVRQFKKQMKTIIETVVNQNKRAILFLEDHNFSMSQFLQMINSLMISGQIPGLFLMDQLDRLPAAQQIKRNNIGKSLYEAVCDRVKQNLKIVLSLDYTREGFHQICASNPAIFASNIIWFDGLSNSSMRAISSQIISKNLPQFSQSTIDQISGIISQTHRTLQQKYKIAQRSFHELLKTFIQTFKNKSSSKKNQAQHLQKGLQKLHQAKLLVDQLSKQALQKQKILQVKQEQASIALKQIEKAMGQAALRRRQTEQLSGNLQTQQKKIYKKKQSVQEELAQVQPILQQAKKSVSGISSSNLSELASLPKPPQAVKIVMKSVVRMFGETNPQWNAIKTFIKNKSFIDNILNFDPRSIRGQIRAEVEKQVQKNSMYFQKQTIYRASLAAGPLADWTKAIIRYSKVVQSIQPLQNQLNKLFKALQSSKKRVLQCEEQLSKIDEKVKQLKKIFSSKTGQAQLLKIQLAKSQQTLKRAQNLLSKLQDQKVRWEQDFKNIQKQVRNYPVNSYLASAFIIYLSDKDQNQRLVMQKKWRQIAKIQHFDFLKFMINQSIQLKWRALGLASDLLSVQNSTIVNNTSKTPLIMDPNNSAIEWLKKSVQKIQVINQRHPKFTNNLQLAVRFGKSLLIQQLDNIQPILVSTIRKDLQQDGSRIVIKIGDKTLEYNSEFKLYLSTRNTNMHLPSNMSALISLINYSVTKSGLESKLLSLIINHEKPQIEKNKSQLLHKEEQLKMSLVKLEEELLQELGSSSGNILQNKALLDNLTKTKIQSASIAQSLKQSQILNTKLDIERDTYRPLAIKGATIYLILSQLHKINNMYKFSLQYFTKLFLSCLESNNKLSLEKNLTGVGKLQISQKSLNKIVFNNIASSLFKVDRLSFALYLIKGLFPQQITEAEWQFFTGITPPPLQNKFILPTWSTYDRQQSFNHFCSSLPKLAKSINFNDIQFQQWNKSIQAQKSFPKACLKLSKFQQLLIIMVFKPQKLQSALINYACDILTVSSISGIQQSFKQISQKQINNQTPALFIVSTGYDPSKQLQQFCEAEVGRQNYLQLSMGGGQNQIALKMLMQAAKFGKWVCFKNLHLVTAWLPILQKQIKNIQQKHPNFRIFLTSQQHYNFPNVLLQSCFKVSYQSPPGLKKSFLRTYQQIQSPGNNLRGNLVFLLAYFHALIQQRRGYIPQGWSKSYQFSYSDLKVSLQIIDNIVKEYEITKNLNLETLYGTFQQGIYGGRIDNPSDQKVLKAYLKKYFNLLIINGDSPVGFQCNIPKNQKQLHHFISKMPEIDTPDIFGLPKNIDKLIQRKNVSYTTSSLKKLSSVVLQGTALNKEDWNKVFEPLIKIWKQIYKQIKDSKFPSIKNSQLMSENPIQSFIYLEATQGLQLLQKSNRLIELLENIIQGKSLMTSQIQKFMNKISARQLPKQWQQFWPQADQPIQWIRKFGKKILAIKNWVYKAQNSRLIGEQYDLAQLFHPAVFLNACKQNSSRNNIALDKLNLVVTFQEARASENAIKLKGLLIQGCSLAKHLLGAPSLKDEQYEQLPIMYVDFLPNPPPMYPNVQQFCLFSSQSRQYLLMKMRLGINGNHSEKIIAGTALFLREI